MEHVIGDVTTDAATVDVAVGLLLGIPVSELTGLAVDVMVEAVVRVVVDVVYTACITLFTSIIVADDIVSVHTDGDIDPNEPTNISLFCAVEWTQEIPQSFQLNDSAPQNMWFMVTTRDTSHFEMSPLNDVAPLNMPHILVTRDTSQFEMSPLKDVALLNMLHMSVTLDTSHFEMSPLNDEAPWNIILRSVTRDTSHVPIGPCGPFFEQSPSRRHASKAAWSCVVDCGWNAAVERAGGLCLHARK